MYNRTGQGQNMSQFIKGKIAEENNDDLEEEETLGLKMAINQSLKTSEPIQMSKIKNDDDFMFLMDKGFL